MLLLQIILSAQTDDSGSLVQILFVIIIFAISIISNNIKSRSTKASQQKGNRPTRGPVRQVPEPQQATPPTHQQDQTGSAPSPQQARAETAVPPRPAARQERRVREVSLRPRSVDVGRKGTARRYPPGGFGEVLSGKSRLDRFLESKLAPTRRPAPARERGGLEASSHEAESLDDFARLELEKKPKRSKPEKSAAVKSFELNADNLADAIVYAEILGKPLALREPPGLA